MSCVIHVVKSEERDQKNIGVEDQRDDVLLHYLSALGICVRIGVTGGLRRRLGFFYLKSHADKKYMYLLVNYSWLPLITYVTVSGGNITTIHRASFIDLHMCVDFPQTGEFSQFHLSPQ